MIGLGVQLLMFLSCYLSLKLEQSIYYFADAVQTISESVNVAAIIICAKYYIRALVDAVLHCCQC